MGRALSASDHAAFDRAVRLTRDLPGIEISTSYGYPALKVGGKLVANLCSEPGALAVHCPVETKAILVEAKPEHYFDTPHFSGWPSVLVRSDAIDDQALAARLEAAWMQRAPKALLRRRAQTQD